MTVREALTRAASQLSAHPDLRATAVADATLLLMHCLQVERVTLIAHPERLLSREEQAAIQRLVERRLLFEPVQYITGRQDFYGLSLCVTKDVLIPRPETELLVEAVLERLPQDLDVQLADVGTGSGAIAIALVHQLPRLFVTALDLSPAALELAQKNAVAHHVDGRIRFLESDLLVQIADDALDAVVSNPPYVPDGDAATLHPQVREFEPGMALFAGADGMAVYDRLIPQARRKLKPGGMLALEMGYGQREAMTKLLRGWQQVEFLNDLQGIARVALARR